MTNQNKGRPKRALWLFFVLFSTLKFSLFAQTGTVVNKYVAVTNINNSSLCAPQVTIGATGQYADNPSFTVGSQVIIIQMKGAVIDGRDRMEYGNITDYGYSGNYEFATISSRPAGSDVLTFSARLVNNYDPMGQVQLVLVSTAPSYASAITCAPWNGSLGIGGVVALSNSSSITLGGNIDVSGMGFTGGAVSSLFFIPGNPPLVSDYYPTSSTSPGNDYGGGKGEGITSIATSSNWLRGKAANGGGGANYLNAGGGGGSNFGSGGKGGFQVGTTNDIGGVGGADMSVNIGAALKAYLGGGGGGGHQGDSYSPQTADATPGANGGGIIIISTPLLTSTAPFNIWANGLDAFATNHNGGIGDDGAGGGGGGGSVLLFVGSYGPNSFDIEAKGGNGGDNSMSGTCHAPGGGGGGGYIAYSTTSISSPTNVSGGNAGSVHSGNICGSPNTAPHFGAVAGNNGATIPSIVMPQPGPCCPTTVTGNYNGSYSGQTFNTNQVWAGKIYIASTVTINNATLDLTNVDIIFDQGAGIIFNGTSTIRANNSVFRACDLTSTWAGFTFNGTSSGVINECVFKNAEIAENIVTATTSIRTTNNLFSNCQVAISMNTQNQSSPESITGNTFQIDNMPITWPNPTSPYDDYFGVKLVNTSMKQLISQNNFVYANIELQNANKRFFGISVNGGNVGISDNHFTNMYRCVDVSDPSSFVSIENNSMDLTQQLQLQPVLGIYQIRISDNIHSAQILVYGNQITNQLAQEGYGDLVGIYGFGANNLHISNNTIKGFTSCIYGSHLSTGSTITENNISDGQLYGMIFEECAGIVISSNVIKLSAPMVFAPTSRGISYSYQGENYAVPTISKNAIFDCNVSLYLTAGGSLTIPNISDNFFYNYSSQGIYNVNFVNSGACGIGCGCTIDQAGRNTFACNYRGRAGFGTIIDIFSNVALSAFGNFFNGAPVVSSGVSNNNCANAFHSMSSNSMQLGRVAAPLTSNQVFDENIVASYPISSVNSVYSLNSGYEENIQNTPAASRMGYVMSMMSIVAANADNNEMDKLYAAASPKLSAKEQAWLKFYYLYYQDAYSYAMDVLNSMQPNSQDDKDLVYVRKLQLDVKIHNRDITKLTKDELASLTSIDNRRGAYAAIARDMIHQSIGGHDYIFPKMEVQQPEMEGAATQGSDGSMTIYPNPAGDEVSLQYNCSDITKGYIRISDMQGRMVQQIPMQFNTTVMHIDLSQLAKGAYMVSMVNDKGVQKTEKLLIK